MEYVRLGGRSIQKRIFEELNNNFFWVQTTREALLTDDELKTPPYEINLLTGEPIVESLYQLVDVYLPLGRIIDIFANGSELRLKYKKDVSRLVLILDKVTDMIEKAGDSISEEALELFEDFRDTVEGKIGSLANKQLKEKTRLDIPVNVFAQVPVTKVDDSDVYGEI